MKILLIEDESKIANYLKKGLTESGFVVDHAEDGESGLYLAQTGNYDIIILDVMLPKLDGWSVIKNLRDSGKNTLSLFLTARDSVDDRVKGWELGADGYLVKPFSFSELLAQIKSLLRRTPQRQANSIKIKDLEIDLIQHKAFRNGKKLDLTPKEFSLLSLLGRKCGEVISQTQISEQVWDINFDNTTNVVEVHIRRLRSKVDDPFDHKLIHTVRGMGYVLRGENE